VHGQYAPAPKTRTDGPQADRQNDEEGTAQDEGEPAVIEVTYGYSRDHREDLKQWMLALVTSGEGVPQFLPPLDGNTSDKRALFGAVSGLTQQLQESGETPGVYVAESGLYRAENITQLNAAGVPWVSRVPETSTAAQAMVQERLESPDAWQSAANGACQWWSRQRRDLLQGPERWIVVRTHEGEERARATLQRQVDTTRDQWEKQLWHLSNQRFACQPDAQAALAHQLKQCPQWLSVQARLIPHPKQHRAGRPRQGTPPDRTEWQIQATVSVAEEAVTRAVQRKASFLVATNVLAADQLADQELIRTYKDQHSVERGFSLLKDPLFLASSVFVKKGVCRQRHLIG
jgi:transposase